MDQCWVWNNYYPFSSTQCIFATARKVCKASSRKCLAFMILCTNFCTLLLCVAFELSGLLDTCVTISYTWQHHHNTQRIIIIFENPQYSDRALAPQQNLSKLVTQSVYSNFSGALGHNSSGSIKSGPNSFLNPLLNP